MKKIEITEERKVIHTGRHIKRRVKRKGVVFKPLPDASSNNNNKISEDKFHSLQERIDASSRHPNRRRRERHHQKYISVPDSHPFRHRGMALPPPPQRRRARPKHKCVASEDQDGRSTKAVQVLHISGWEYYIPYSNIPPTGWNMENVEGA